MTNEDLDNELLNILHHHVGRENAIGRWDLVEKIYGPVVFYQRNDDNLDDRKIRAAVSRLREHGYFICDQGNGKGRYLASNAAILIRLRRLGMRLPTKWARYTTYKDIPGREQP